MLERFSYPHPCNDYVLRNGDNYHELVAPAYAATKELWAMWNGPDQVFDFLRRVIAVNDAQRITFWITQIKDNLPDDQAIDYLCELQTILTDLHGPAAATEVVAACTNSFPDAPGTDRAVRTFVHQMESRAPIGPETVFSLPHPSIAKWLNDRYVKAPDATWPLIRKFWTRHPLIQSASEFAQMWMLCEAAPYRRAMAEDMLTWLVTMARPYDQSGAVPVLAHYMSDYGTDTSPDLLLSICRLKNPAIIAAGLFWLCAFHRDHPSTFDTVMAVAETHETPWLRDQAFRLAFFHFYDRPECAKRVVDASQAFPDEVGRRKGILAGQGAKIETHYQTPQSRAITETDNGPDRARVFAGICKRAGIDSGVAPRPAPDKALLSFLDDIINDKLTPVLKEALIISFMNKRERATLRKITRYEKFERAQMPILDSLSSDGASVARWLDAALDSYLLQCGFWIRAHLVVDMAVRHLAPDDISDDAIRIRQKSEFFDTIKAIVATSLKDPARDAKRRDANASAEEVVERAFFLLSFGKETDLARAVERALDDACAQAD